MSQIETWSFTEPDLSAFMQNVKSVIMTDLVNKDLISEETYQEYTKRKFLTLRKPSFFTRAWKKIFSYENDNDYIILCTAENLSFREEEEQSDKPELKIIPLTDKQKNSE